MEAFDLTASAWEPMNISGDLGDTASEVAEVRFADATDVSKAGGRAGMGGGAVEEPDERLSIEDEAGAAFVVFVPAESCGSKERAGRGGAGSGRVGGTGALGTALEGFGDTTGAALFSVAEKVVDDVVADA